MQITRYPDHSPRTFLRRTVSAQIHLLGCLLVCVGAFWMIPLASQAGVGQTIAAIAFLISGFLVFLASTTLHFLDDGYILGPGTLAKFEKLDHFSIYLLIAGTYSPFLLTAMLPQWRAPLLIAMWTFAILGICYTSIKSRLPRLLQSRPFYTGLYFVMGWMALVRIGDTYDRLSSLQLGLLAAGGVSYSIGALVYAFKWPNPWKGVFAFHEIWHVLVIMGFVFHFFLIASTFSSPNCQLSTDTLWITACARLAQ